MEWEGRSRRPHEGKVAGGGCYGDEGVEVGGTSADSSKVCFSWALSQRDAPGRCPIAPPPGHLQED